jgi:BirA family biotin operon repressor/biotin-[acetyl-CoA-carboxylase] ligase
LNPSDPAPAASRHVAAPDVIPDDIEHGLALTAARRGAFGSAVQWFPAIASTNDRALAWAVNGAVEGSLVGADAQTHGRGRHGRVWVSPPGAGIYASLVLRPDAGTAALLTLAAGVALVEGVEAATGLRAGVKWPNDVYVEAGRGVAGARKLAGILAEAGVSGGTAPAGAASAGTAAGTASNAVQHVVLGFGINVMPSAYPPDVADRATSLEVELGRAVDRGLVLGECLAALRRRYEDLRRARTAEVLEAWRARAAATFGRSVEWEGHGGLESGVACDIDAQGALLVRRGSTMARVVAGEVRWTS